MLLALSCTKFASELDQPEETQAVSAPVRQLAPVGGDWSCVDAAATGAPEERLPLTYSFSVIDFVTDAPLADVRVRACFRPDVNCDSPLSEVLVPDAEGRVNVTAYAGFNGYLEITSAGMLPVLAFFAEPWSAAFLEQLEQLPVQLLPIASVQALGASARAQLDPASGMLALVTRDCQGVPAPGVRMQIDTPAIAYVFVDDLPVANQDLTSDQGFVGFVNVTPGVVVVRGFAADRAEPISVDSLLVRPGWSSTMNLLPSFAR
jgi:hypothetical protein